MQHSVSLGYRFKSLSLFCISEDGQTVERLYEIPEKDVIKRSSITIAGKYNDWDISSHKRYRITKEEELKKVNEIWKKILEEEKGGIYSNG